MKGVSKVEYPFKGVTLRVDDMDLTAYFFQVTLNATYRRRLIKQWIYCDSSQRQQFRMIPAL